MERLDKRRDVAELGDLETAQTQELRMS